MDLANYNQYGDCSNLKNTRKLKYNRVVTRKQNNHKLRKDNTSKRSPAKLVINKRAK